MSDRFPAVKGWKNVLVAVAAETRQYPSAWINRAHVENEVLLNLFQELSRRELR